MTPTDTRSGDDVLTTESLWIRRAVRESAALRLICLPYGGGGASAFNALTRALPESVEVVAVQLPGREERYWEELPQDPRFLVRACAVALRPYCTTPFAFYGHCAGALLAYEVACEMEDRFGLRPLHLVAGAQAAPHVASAEPPLHELSDDEFVDVLRKRGGLPGEVLSNTALLTFLLPRIRADFTMWERYAPRTRTALPYPVTTLRGSGDTLLERAQVESWRSYTTAEFADREVDGGHLFIIDNAEDSARALTEVLSVD
ncbi:alpha/beta fold hydrolase [Nocardiopsis sp. ATB16-24]|uniref:thioesterase II family protein n=1 Tax=Nocardiopsis sp. ATB16-24 TaxID=3019555 RepID=UPI00255656BE|nr:alpha/beta fold hydrolase [Nocardiopsis sp. ATB16-24]